MHSRLVEHLAPAISIRVARRGDLDALIALEHQVFLTDRLSRRSFQRLMQSQSAAVLVAQDRAGVFAGTTILLFRAGSDVARLYSIAVVPVMGGRGVGAALLEGAEAVARARGCNMIRLEAQETNAAARSLYDKSGYREFGRHRAYYEDGGDALRFEKQLAGAGKRTSLSRARSPGR